MSSPDESSIRDRWARLRLLIIGQLLAAPPARGELKQRLSELSRQTWRHPIHGGDVRFGVSTLERWLALARRSPDPAAMLATVPRADAGHMRAIDAVLADAIRAQYAAHPKWNVQLHYDNPFSTELPSESLYLSPKINDFFWRIENVHIREGGFALIQGDPGTGKSVVLRALADRLERQTDLTVGILNHPQSNLGDFYRELAEVFGVSLKPSNRWGGFKTLRERWVSHLESTRVRCCLLIDEAQEMSPKTLLELRLLASARFDSQPLLAVVLAGDGRLNDALARDELLPLGTRIRARLSLDYASRDELAACLDHLLETAGAAALMSKSLKHTLCERAGGNYRVMTNMAAQLLAVAAQRQLPLLDDKLYLEVFASPSSNTQAARRNARAGAR